MSAEQSAAVIEAVQRSRLFRGVAAEALATLVPTLRERRFRNGETIFHAGDPGEAMHVIGSARVKISVESPEGEEAILVTLGAGEVFGEIVLLDGAPRSATAVAVERPVRSVHPAATPFEVKTLLAEGAATAG